MTDRKALHRKRKAAGFLSLKDKYVRTGDQQEVSDHLLTAAEVDAEIAKRGSDDV